MPISVSVRSPHVYHIRLAAVDDVQSLPLIERSAAVSFRTCKDPDLSILADDEHEPTNSDAHIDSIHRWNSLDMGPGGTWVAVRTNTPPQAQGEGAKNSSEIVVAFIKCQMVQIGSWVTNIEIWPVLIVLSLTFLHIDELSVHHEHQRRGLATQLIEVVKDTASRLHHPSLGGQLSNRDTSMNVIGITLVTMRTVPFNGPFYEKVGFDFIDGCEREIKDEFGMNAPDIWLEDLGIFRQRGLADQRCWMRYLCPRWDCSGFLAHVRFWISVAAFWAI